MWVSSKTKIGFPEITAEWKTDYSGKPAEIVLGFESSMKMFLSFDEARQIVMKLTAVLADPPVVEESG